jgi:hypothetical protein
VAVVEGCCRGGAWLTGSAPPRGCCPATRDPPREQLLVGLEVGGVSFVRRRCGDERCDELADDTARQFVIHSHKNGI